MTNREAQKRLRKRGWTYRRDLENWNDAVCAYPRSGSKGFRVVQELSWHIDLRDANRRLVEFVETHFGEGK